MGNEWEKTSDMNNSFYCAIGLFSVLYFTSAKAPLSPTSSPNRVIFIFGGLLIVNSMGFLVNCSIMEISATKKWEDLDLEYMIAINATGQTAIIDGDTKTVKFILWTAGDPKKIEKSYE